MKLLLTPLLFVVILVCSCNRFLEVDLPPDKVLAERIYATNKSAASVLTGILYDMQSNTDRYGISQGRASLSLHCGIISDEIAALPGSYLNGHYRNNSRPTFWKPLYELIYHTNSAVEGLSNSKTLTSEVKDQLLGEAYFLRAFFYFYLVNLYGDVPLITNADYKINSQAERTSVDEVYNNIIDDLKLAKSLLSDQYKGPHISSVSEDRIRPNKSAAAALLARIYLYTRRWADAADQASLLINNKALYDTTALENVFLKNSKEAIWQLQPNDENGNLRRNTLDADIFVLLNGPNAYQKPVVASEFLLQAFEKNDNRNLKWIGVNKTTNGTYYYPFKYKTYPANAEQTEYLMVLRLAEQYLIRAEARVNMGDLKGAIEDLNILRHRAGLPDTDAQTLSELSAAVLHERQVELFSEWGHRWFDLKRTGKINEVMSKVTPLKGGTWETYKQLLDIPLYDLKYNSQLEQNPGYPKS